MKDKEHFFPKTMPYDEILSDLWPGLVINPFAKQELQIYLGEVRALCQVMSLEIIPPDIKTFLELTHVQKKPKIKRLINSWNKRIKRKIELYDEMETAQSARELMNLLGEKDKQDLLLTASFELMRIKIDFPCKQKQEQYW